MLDRLDRLLWFLQRRRMLVLGFAGTLIVAVAIGFVVRGSDDKPTAKVPSDAVATVGSQRISRATFDHWIGVYRRSGVGGTQPTTKQANTAVLRILVAASWTEQEAAAKGLKVSDTQVAQAVAQVFSTASKQGVTKANVLKQVGGTEADLSWEERSTLLGQALQTNAAKAAKPVTAAAIAAQYAAEPSRWAHPSRRNVEVALTADAANGTKAKTAMAAGKKVTGLQTLKRIVPGARNASFERAVFAAPVGKLVGPVPVGSGYMVFRVLRSTPMAARSLKSATPVLRSELTAVAQQQAVSDYLTAFRKSWRAKTTCAATLRDTTICANA
ncbi:MAG: foldase protein PrsA [Solirubrobacteraceae bacterium]|nr:foldase protein PrsA [Solirubrobacteraceae bacterium]